MSRKLFAFLLSELKTVRVICPHCGGAAEMTIDQLAMRFGGNRTCIACNQSFGIGDNADNTLTRLAKAMREYQTTQANAKFPDLEFVLPDATK
jgi:hypothetical protein